jgi:hypothetical protein
MPNPNEEPRQLDLPPVRPPTPPPEFPDIPQNPSSEIQRFRGTLRADLHNPATD